MSNQLFPFPDTFDNTMLSNFCSCHRKFYWFSRRVFSSFNPPYFAFGRAFGVGVNTWHQFQGKQDVETRLGLALVEAQKEWMRDNPDEDNTNNLENLCRLLEDYTLVYGEFERWEPAYKSGELGFTFPIQGTPYSYGGSIDQPIDWPGYGIMLREDKTTGGWITPNYMEQWDFSTQVVGYLWAFTQLQGKVPYGTLMNVASKKPRKDKDLQFGRRIVEHSEWKISEFINGTTEIIQNIERCYSANSFPMTGARDPIHCTGGMGRSACDYKGLCLIAREPDEISDEELISLGYTIKGPWAPWEREGENE